MSEYANSVQSLKVAPYAGVWIEIYITDKNAEMEQMSLPTRERGLKSHAGQRSRRRVLVAPYAGAWIEISGSLPAFSAFSCRSPRGSVD